MERIFIGFCSGLLLGEGGKKGAFPKFIMKKKLKKSKL